VQCATVKPQESPEKTPGEHRDNRERKKKKEKKDQEEKDQKEKDQKEKDQKEKDQEEKKQHIFGRVSEKTINKTTKTTTTRNIHGQPQAPSYHGFSEIVLPHRPRVFSVRHGKHLRPIHVAHFCPLKQPDQCFVVAVTKK